MGEHEVKKRAVFLDRDGVLNRTVVRDGRPFPPANVRVMVPNVDDLWVLANDLGARIVVPIGDRYYGLRDFIVEDPNGYRLRFASPRRS